MIKLLKYLNLLKGNSIFIGMFVYVVILSGCVQKFIKPAINLEASQEEREQVYKDCKLNIQGHAFFGQFKVTQGTNENPLMYWMLDSETKEISQEAAKHFFDGNVYYRLCSLVLGFGMAGIFLPIIDAIAFREGKMTIGGWLLLGGGIGTTIISYFLSEGATSSYKSGVKEYNTSLKKKLKLEEREAKVSFNLIPYLTYDFYSSEMRFYTSLITVNF